MYYANVKVNSMDQNVIQIKNEIMINVNACAKKNHICEKGDIWNSATCSCKNGKYLTSIIDSVIKCDEIMDANAEAKLYDQDKQIKRVRYLSLMVFFKEND